MNFSLYLIRRGPRPEFHKAPFHPVIICTRRHTAMWEAGYSGDGAWAWIKEGHDESGGWLLVRWQGLDIDYGHIVHCFELPDGTKSGFFHHKDMEPWTLIESAVWWSEHKIPGWLLDFGVALPADGFSRARIFDDAGECLLAMSDQDRLRESRRKMLNNGKLMDVRGLKGD